jgi:hypothetical protein
VESLKTDILEFAKIKLREFASGASKVATARTASERGGMTMSDCATTFGEPMRQEFGLWCRGNRLRPIFAIKKGCRHPRHQSFAARRAMIQIVGSEKRWQPPQGRCEDEDEPTLCASAF